MKTLENLEQSDSKQQTGKNSKLSHTSLSHLSLATISDTCPPYNFNSCGEAGASTGHGADMTIVRVLLAICVTILSGSSRLGPQLYRAYRKTIGVPIACERMPDDLELGKAQPTCIGQPTMRQLHGNVSMPCSLPCDAGAFPGRH